MSVFVSGFTGYIALHVVKQLLEKGYTVVGSVRSTEKGEKYAKFINNPKFSYVVVENIAVENSFDKVFQDHPEFTTVYHVASPVIFDPVDPESEILAPAVKGTTSILESISKYGKNVKKVVVTSSNAAHNAPYDHYGNKTGVVTEDSVSSMTRERALKEGGATVYWASKKLSERAAWQFMETQKPHFQLATVAPAWCFGPQAYDELAAEVPSTLNILKVLFDLKPDSQVEYNPMVVVDVRDIARLHIVAGESDAANGGRWLLSSGKADNYTLLNLINKFYPDAAVPKVDAPAEEDIDCIRIECTKTLKLYGQELTPFETTIKDNLDQFKLGGIF